MRTRTELTLGILGVLLSILLLWYYWAAFDRRDAQLSNLTSARSSGNAQNTNGEPVTLDMATIAQHQIHGDCWLLIEGTVYDVTPYLQVHPGGVDIVVPYCGKDATTAFLTKDGRGTHSFDAMQDLKLFAIGALGSTTTTATLQQLQTNIQATPLPVRGESENESEDDDD